MHPFLSTIFWVGKLFIGLSKDEKSVILSFSIFISISFKPFFLLIFVSFFSSFDFGLLSLDLFDEDVFWELLDSFDNKGVCCCFSLLFLDVNFLGFCLPLLFDTFLFLRLRLIEIFFVEFSFDSFLIRLISFSFSFEDLSSVLLLLLLLLLLFEL